MADLPDIDVRDLRLILQVADHRSFTAAAEAAHLSQSALSRAVNEAERRLGARLFERTTRSVRITPAGAELVRLGSSMLSSHEQGLREFTLFRDGIGGLVKLAALPSIAATVLPRLVADLGRQSDGIVLEIHDTLAHTATDELLAGHVDLAVTSDRDLPANVAFAHLTSDRFHVVHPRDHRFTDRADVTWSELGEEPLVAFGPASSLRALTDATLDDLGITPRSVVEAQNIGVIAGLVSAGLGVAAAPETVLPLMSFADLQTTPLTEPSVDRSLGLVTASDRPPSPPAQQVAARLASLFATP